MHYKKYIMLPEDLFLTVFNTNREYISNSINTIWQKKKFWGKFSDSTFWNGNGLDYKNKWYKFLLFIIIIEVHIDYLLEIFLEVKGKINFPWSLCGASFVKNKELDWKKRPFSSTFQVPKKSWTIQGIQRI